MQHTHYSLYVVCIAVVDGDLDDAQIFSEVIYSDELSYTRESSAHASRRDSHISRRESGIREAQAPRTTVYHAGSPVVSRDGGARQISAPPTTAYHVGATSLIATSGGGGGRGHHNESVADSSVFPTFFRVGIPIIDEPNTPIYAVPDEPGTEDEKDEPCNEDEKKGDAARACTGSTTFTIMNTNGAGHGRVGRVPLSGSGASASLATGLASANGFLDQHSREIRGRSTSPETSDASALRSTSPQGTHEHRPMRSQTPDSFASGDSVISVGSPRGSFDFSDAIGPGMFETQQSTDSLSSADRMNAMRVTPEVMMKSIARHGRGQRMLCHV